MNEQELRQLFTEIGCIMEDASVTALVWECYNSNSISDRGAKLREAHNKIGVLIDIVECHVR